MKGMRKWLRRHENKYLVVIAVFIVIFGIWFTKVALDWFLGPTFGCEKYSGQTREDCYLWQYENSAGGGDYH